MRTLDDLHRRLGDIDGRGYGAYKSIRGGWVEGPLTLHVDHVQADPFASPSRVRVHLAADAHGIPSDLFETPPRRTALTDKLLRVFAREVEDLPRVDGSGKSGQVMVSAGDAEILVRSGCHIDSGGLELRFRVGLPARGRTVLGRAASRLLTELLPDAAEAVLWDELDGDAVRAHVTLAEDHAHLEGVLRERRLVCFVRDGSILPRESGVSSHPLEGAVPFVTPESLRVTLPTLHHGEVTGMGLPEGVTLITGGGFHGKTTLLEAIQVGVYPHVPGDGREWVVTRRDAFKVRSEDGRAVTGVDLRPFIRDVPRGRNTAWFTTEDASGSTSLAASIVEAVEAGARSLLFDEDTCATNLLIRDARMQALVERETIVPLIDRIRELHASLGVSALLVLGGSGDYLDVADRVLLLEDYLPKEVTERARQVAGDIPTRRGVGVPDGPMQITPRAPLARSFNPRRGRKEKIRSRGLSELLYGEETLDLSALEQLVDDGQARGIGVLLRTLERLTRERRPLRDAVEEAIHHAETRGLYDLDPSPELVLPRSLELAAAVNRLRGLSVDPVAPTKR